MSERQAPDLWAAHLEKDEQLQWHGRPKTGFLTSDNDDRWRLSVLAFLPLLLLLTYAEMTQAVQTTGPDPDGLTLLVIWVLYILEAASLIYSDWLLRAHTHYAITDRRALKLIVKPKILLSFTLLSPETTIHHARWNKLFFDNRTPKQFWPTPKQDLFPRLARAGEGIANHYQSRIHRKGSAEMVVFAALPDPKTALSATPSNARTHS